MNQDYYSGLSSVAVLPDGREVVTHYPILGPESFEIRNGKNMAITKEELFKELSAAHQQFTEATRRVFMLMMQVQNMPDFDAALEFVRQHKAGLTQLPPMGSASAQAAPGLSFNPTSHPHDRSGHTDGVGVQPTAAAAAAAASSAAATKLFETQAIVAPAETITNLTGQKPAEAHVWQLNTAETVNAGAAEQVPQGNEVVAGALADAKGVVTQLLKDKGLPAEVIAMVEQVSVQDLLNRGKVVTPPQLPAGPTEVVDAVQEPSPLQLLVGMGSVFCEYLHPDVIRGGQGEIQPKCNDDIKRYSQDAMITEIKTLIGYPTGFYTNSQSKAMQFFVKTDQFLAVVDGLPSEVAPLYIHFLGDPTGWTHAQNLGPSELRLIHSKLDFVLGGVKKKN
jgi:hypothetical protein